MFIPLYQLPYLKRQSHRETEPDAEDFKGKDHGRLPAVKNSIGSRKGRDSAAS